MPPTRTFSFETDDERALSANEQERFDHHALYQNRPIPDSPSRDIISPPPRYTSPSPPHEHRLPDSPSHSHAYADSPPDRHSFSTRMPVGVPNRRPVPERSQPDTPSPPPPPPPHRTTPNRNLGYRYSDMDGEDIAARMPAMRDMAPSPPGLGGPSPVFAQSTTDRDRDVGHPESPYAPQRPAHSRSERSSFTSNYPLRAAAATPGTVTPEPVTGLRSARHSNNSIPLDDFTSRPHDPRSTGFRDSPYQSYSHNYSSAVAGASINPYDIADDGDDGFMPEPARQSVFDIGRQRGNEILGKKFGTGNATTRGPLASLGGLFGRNPKQQPANGRYDAVDGGSKTAMSALTEKSEWLARQTKGNNKMRWTVGFAIGIVIILAVIGGAVGAVISSKHSAGTNPNANDNTAAGDTAANGDLGINSAQIQGLLNNPNLHKVFPGMDYTPWGTQYPLCMTYPPSQNNVTRDMAVLSQLTNAVRLYGTDCNQTEMVLHAIERLELTDMKVWLGVWIDSNQTTTDRQLAQMYKILGEVKDVSIFKGVIVGNEYLYRSGDTAAAQATLTEILTDVRANFTRLGYSLPVATSDLGDNWTAQLAEISDIIMANIHPFFAGVPVSEAADWTMEFWTTHDKVLTQGTNKRNIISELGGRAAAGPTVAALPASARSRRTTRRPCTPSPG